MTVYVQQQVGRTDLLGGVRTWTQATKRLSGLPSDTSERIANPGNFERHAFGRYRALGAPQTDFGVAVWHNEDSALDDLVLAGVDGQEMRLYIGQDSATTFGRLTLYLKGTTSVIRYADRLVQLDLRNRQAEVADLALQSDRYAGDNSPPDGVEGTAADLKDAFKPIWLGFRENVTVILVNTSKHIYQLSTNGEIAISGSAPTAVWDKGVEFTATKVEKVTWSAFTHATGPSGELWWYSGPEGWFIRLEAAADGTVTVTAQEGTAANTTTAQLVKRILEAKGVSPSDIEGVDTLDAKNPEPIGYFAGLNEIRVGTALADILAGVIGTWTDDRLGAFTIARLELPKVVADHTFKTWQLLRNGDDEGFRIVQGEDEPGNPVPLSEAVALYRRNETVQRADDLAGAAVGTDHAAFVAEEYRREVADNSDVLVKHATAVPFEFPTLFKDATAAATAALRYVDLFGVRRFIVEVDLATEEATAVKLLQTVSIPIGRFDWNTRNFVVIGIVDELDTQPTASKTTLILWG